MSFFELVKSRYSVRSFKSLQIEPEKLAQVLEAGRLAPTAHNEQPQRIMIISDPDDLAKVDECTPCRFKAPTVILIGYDRNTCWKRKFDGAGSGEVDAAIVTTHLMLAAQDAGLGTCWVMFFDPVKLTELFSLPEHIIPVALLPIGYPADDAVPAAFHGQRVQLTELMIYEKAENYTNNDN